MYPLMKIIVRHNYIRMRVQHSHKRYSRRYNELVHIDFIYLSTMATKTLLQEVFELEVIAQKGSLV